MLTVAGTVYSTSGGFKFPDGSTQTTASSGGTPDWHVTGNAGTTPGTNFLGTTDNQALEIKVNSLRTMRIEPNATSPNILGGYSGNNATAGVKGATIAGGGRLGSLNSVTDPYGTVGGGIGNRTGDGGPVGDSSFATVGGGSYNIASGLAATISGGAGNTASANNAVVGGGYYNTASGGYTVVSGGSNNTASGGGAAVGGGQLSVASGLLATVGGGSYSMARGDYSVVSGGGGPNSVDSNCASGVQSTVGGGAVNVAKGTYSTVGGGARNRAFGLGATVEAYIASQQSEGWIQVAERYEDNGFSGARAADRPALQRLLDDIRAGRVDVVVVAKIDRLSRSLLDFVRMLELFEKSHVTFVSVSQHIVTSTSTGRLMLNVLMSFAQFEREIISDRTSSFMCSARRLGKHMGGPPVLGYDLDREKHRLVVNAEEAAMVRELFDLYLQHSSLLKVSQIANKRGWTTKSWARKDGTKREGGVLDKAKLERILTNVTYAGQVQHKGEILPGEHEGIVDQDTFDRVQALIRENGNGSGGVARNKHGALLRGLLYCGACGAAMSHHYAKKNGSRLYRYYVCTTKQKRGRDACSTPSLPAQEIEDFVVEQIRKLARDPDLARQVFQEASRQQQSSIPLLKAERTRLQRERQHQAQEIKRLVTVIGAADRPSPSVTERLSQLEESVATIDRRLGEIDSELHSIAQSTIDPGHVAATLAEFTELWDVLYPQEKTRIVHLMVERVVYGGDDDGIQLIFRSQCPRALAPDPDHASSVNR
jgi:site-specific DNA recombinase